MRKRTLIAIIITVVVIALTNKYWFIIRPMPVDFEVWGKDDCKIEVQLNKRDDDQFKHIKKQKLDINLNETNHAYFNVNRAKKPKRLRVIFTNLEKPVTLSKIQLRDGKFKPNLNKFVARNGELKIEDNVLTIYPGEKPVILDYTDRLNIRSAVKFDFKIFVIIAVLTYLFAFKMSNYVADFKSVRGKSRIEIIFLTLFFIFLFVPMSYINQDEISQKENRTLAKWKPFISNNEINYNFGKDVNDWFNDRFNLRAPMVKLYTNIKYFSSSEYYEADGVFVNKKTKWISGKVPAKITINQDEKEKIIYSLNALKEFCKQNNIKPYIIVAPTKYEIYNDKLYPFINVADNYEVKSKLFEEIKNETGFEIVYPFNELKELSKRDYAFFKTDHHWTDEGAYLAYELVMEQIKKDFPNLYINKRDDFEYFTSNKVRVEPDYGFYEGREYYRLGIDDNKIFNTEYKYLKHKNENKLKIEALHFNGINMAHYKYQYDTKAPNLVLFGDSFTLNMLQSIVYSFNKTKNIFVWCAQKSDKENFSISAQKDEILKDNPKILILCFSEPNRLGYLFPKEND